MLTMNADATVEKSPALSLNQHRVEVGMKMKTYKNQGRVKVCIVLLCKFFVIPLGMLVVFLVKG